MTTRISNKPETIDRTIRALNRHRRGWAIVRWVASDLLTHLPIVQDGDERYHACRKELRYPDTLSNRIQRELGIR